MNQGRMPTGMEKWIDLKSIKKIESVASSDCFNVVSKKEVRTDNCGWFPGSG